MQRRRVTLSLSMRIPGDEIHTPAGSGDEEETIQQRKERRGLFTTRDEFKEVVAKFAVFQGRNLHIVLANKSRQQRIGVRSRDGCPIRLYGSWDSRRGAFVVRTVVPDHSCIRNMEKNKQLKCSWLADQLLDVFKARPHWPAKEIVETVRRAYRVIVKTDFAYKVKWHAHRKLHGSMREHYGKVGRYLEALKRSTPNTQIELVTYMEKDKPPLIFQRLYVCFEGVQKGWKEGCRKIICVDPCLLKTFLGGQLISAVGRDGNGQMYPIAWAVVEGENKSSWEWFLSNLSNNIGIGDGSGVVVVSDEHQPILRGVSEVLPNAEHIHCARHIYANWHKSFKGDEYKLLFWNCAKAYSQADYEEALEKLAEANPAAAQAFKACNPNVFYKAFLKTEVKADVITSNMEETFNGYIINARTKHLLYMLEDIRASLMKRLVTKKQEMEK
ncbi:uncharacterized protein LOC110695855 [Chenopodium quinoa]|uniref:uncharacterized protein LOC110695855 n=1 Tax=Chenopodium quinoa TaxID=63459 RepID=UPI000B786814|nr:uncharacterized protein LOC110695855 [Chenopodium quinoa]